MKTVQAALHGAHAEVHILIPKALVVDARLDMLDVVFRELVIVGHVLNIVLFIDGRDDHDLGTFGGLRGGAHDD